MLASHQVIAQMAARAVTAGLANAGNVEARNRSRVFVTFPGVKVFATDEDLADDPEDVTWPRVRMHTLQVDVSGTVRDPDDLEGVMSAMAADILACFEATAAASTLQPLPGCALRSTGITRSVATEGELATGTVRVRFEVLFSTRSNDPETLI